MVENQKEIKKRGSDSDILNQLPDGLKRRAVVFVQKNRIQIKKDKQFKGDVLKNRNMINVGYKYDDVDMVIEGVEELLMLFGFINSKSILEGRRIKQMNKFRVSRLIAGSLNQIQLRPFKSGVTLSLIKTIKRDKKTNKNKKVIEINLKIACDEGDTDVVLINQVWSGTEDGLIKKVNTTLSEEDVFNKVSGGITKRRHDI